MCQTMRNYQNDPGETRNLAAHEPSVVAKLRVLLAAQGEARSQLRPGEG